MTGFCDLNQKFSLILAMLIFKSNLNFVLSWTEHVKFYNLGARFSRDESKI